MEFWNFGITALKLCLTWRGGGGINMGQLFFHKESIYEISRPSKVQEAYYKSVTHAHTDIQAKNSTPHAHNKCPKGIAIIKC